MKKTYRTLVLFVVVMVAGFAVPGCGDSGPTGTVQPPQVDDSTPKGKVVEPKSTDEK